MAGCQDKPDGAHTIIIELADPSDQVEETKEELSEESISESDTEMQTGETQSEEMPEIIGFEENVEFWNFRRQKRGKNTTSQKTRRPFHFPTNCVANFPYNRPMRKNAPSRGEGRTDP